MEKSESLKTLKDIETEVCLNEESGSSLVMADVDELREEAIKWIKYLEKGRKSALKEQQTYLTANRFRIIKDKIDYGFDGNIGWIKHFFGIKDEDLK